MSYEIEYRYLAFAFDGQRAYQRMKVLADAMGVGERWWFPDYGPMKCYAVFCESGSNNTIDRFTNKPSRSWQLQYVGAGCEVMERVIAMSSYVERGLTKPFGREQHAETYIAAARKRLKDAMPLERISRSTGSSNLTLRLHVPVKEKLDTHPWLAKAREDGRLAVSDERVVLRCGLGDSETLECDLLAIGQVSEGTCATEASFDRHSGFAAMLDGISRHLAILAKAA